MKNTISNMKYVFSNINAWDRKLLVCLLFSIPLGVAETGVNLVIPAITINTIGSTHPIHHVIVVISTLLGVKLIILLLNTYLNSKRNTAEHKMVLHYISYISKKTMDMDYAYLENPEVKIKMEKANQAANNNHTAAMQIPGNCVRFITGLLKFFLLGGIISFLNPMIIVVLLVTAILQYVTMLYYDAYEHKTKDKRVEVNRKLQYISSISDNFIAGKDIRLFSLGNWLNNLANIHMDEYSRLYKNVAKCKIAMSFISLLIVLLRDGFAYVYLMNAIINKRIAIGDFILYFSAINQFVDVLGNVVLGWEAVQRGSYQISDIREYISMPDKSNRGQGIAVPKDDVTIEFRNVSYTYPNAKKATLNNLNFTIHANEKIAIVGLNGSGKTTLVKLVCGMYIPTKGEVLINHHGIHEYNRDEYYKLLSAVFQKFRCLPLSVAKNIAIHQVDYDKVSRCLSYSGLDKKISKMKDGMDTLLIKDINTNGIELSGGEYQKLMLSRAIYKDAPVYILDEPTAALDPIAECEIYKQYAVFSKKKTTIFVSHRLASTHFCDKIFYMEHGQIKEIGSHKELMKNGKKYAKLYKIQSKYYVDTNNEEMIL